MTEFMNDEFLLSTETARKLYHGYAEKMPIFDYHCHLNPREIAENRKYKNITELWLGGDHYKWRAMRSNGVAEKYITGDADDYDKFIKWAETVEKCIGNPLFHWTHLELRRYFGIKSVLNRRNAENIWSECNEKLQGDDFSSQSLIKRSNVSLICTTDDPADSLEYHLAVKNQSGFKTKILPTFRPDKSFSIDKDDYPVWIEKLGKVTGKNITSYDQLLESLKMRIDFFHECGCRISDHALEPPVFAAATGDELNKIFKSRMNNDVIPESDVRKFKTAIMLFAGEKYAEYGWSMQLHIGTRRNNNSSVFKSLGPDTGCDTIADYTYIDALAQFLDALNSKGCLPKTVLYALNSRDNDALGTLIGCFQEEGIHGKMQFGSAWWFNDHKDGMIKQMTSLANLGLLSNFIGMLTDSRSFLSFTRHEYFRRILCNLIGEWVEKGEFPDDYDILGSIVSGISFNNAVNYFNIQ
ncbi:MAG: glucuronate isomerase [Spirochaetes bacterium]|nr:glucuronate isomerase [Spirochaetota bacterium]